MKYVIDAQNNHLTVALSEHFTYADNKPFKEIMSTIVQTLPQAVTLDFADVDFIDSAGLGMLLLLHESCENNNISLSFQSVTGQVKKIFAIAKFDQLFSL